MNLFFRGIRIVSPLDQCDGYFNLWIRNGTIEYIGLEEPSKIIETEPEVLDGKDLCAMPGFFDMHVHFREPGQTHKEDIKSGAEAAVNGGFTGVVCMPNTLPPIDNEELLRNLQQKRTDFPVDIYFSACITKNRAGKELVDFLALKRAGAVFFTDDGSSVMDSLVFRTALMFAREYDFVIAEHCEDSRLTEGFDIHEGVVATQLGLKGYPAAAENVIIARDILFAKNTGNPSLHICHLSTKEGVSLIEWAKEQGLSVTAEVTPHHLVLTEEAVKDFQTNAKMSPPLRTEEDREKLIIALEDGIIDCIATDHAPHANWEKNVPFSLAPYGIVGLETAVGLVFQLFYHNRKVSLHRIVEWLSINPRKILGLEQPRFQIGQKANITIVDVNQEWIVTSENFRSKSSNSPFLGWKLKGKPVMVINNDGVYKSCL